MLLRRPWRLQVPVLLLLLLRLLMLMQAHRRLLLRLQVGGMGTRLLCRQQQVSACSTAVEQAAAIH